jgi:hypothetical protein
VARSCEHIQGVSLAERLLAPQEGLCSMKLVNLLIIMVAEHD